MLSRILVITVIIVIVTILGWKGLAMRKEIPSQEVVPLNRAVAVINGESADLAERLQIKIHRGVKNSEKLTYDKKGICLIKGLSNQEHYTIEIRRSDMKGMLLYRPLEITVAPRESGSKYIVLVGASVGKAWKFEEIPNRLSWKSDIILGFRAKYDFDKSDIIDSLIALPVPVSGVIIKECAAYFPRDIEQSKKLIKEWVALLTSHQITPILATIVPVTKEHDAKHPGRLITILEFNDFIRQFAFQEKILVLDLEKAVRMSEMDRHLKNEYAQPDGLHLVRKAYDEALDGIVFPMISRAINNHPKE
jgi:hypothetical protein